MYWQYEDRANEPTGSFVCGKRNALWALNARVTLTLLLIVASLSSQAAVREVGAIGLTVGNLDREVEFFTKVLPFEKVWESKSAPGAADELLGLSDTQLRSAELKLGDERITLTEHLTNKGHPIPPDSRSFDYWFQHIAIVARDMETAYEQLRCAKVKHVSTARQTLPAWNKDAGGIKAFCFRDPEDHVLEIIWFPSGKGDPKWQRVSRSSRREEAHSQEASKDQSLLTSAATHETGAPLFLGIDHTATVVSDTDRSLAFYTNVLGLRVVGGAENYGTEQEHLNQVFGARLRITALRAERGPGIEFLEYITPPGGRPLPPDARANDLVFWRTHLVADCFSFLSDGKGGMHARPVSTSALLARSSFAIPMDTDFNSTCHEQDTFRRIESA
jgi:catechol 2,3-dioxygenase-like lactoylglutathione lyase family enzyme